MLSDLSPPAAGAEELADLARLLRMPAAAAEDAEVAALLRGLFDAALRAIETRTGRRLTRRGFRWLLRDWGCGRALALPAGPAPALDAVALIDADGAREALALEGFRVDPLDATLRPAPGTRFPTPPRDGRIEILFTAGHGEGAEAAPPELRLATLQLAAFWFEAGGAGPETMPAGLRDLIAPFRTLRL